MRPGDFRELLGSLFAPIPEPGNLNEEQLEKRAYTVQGVEVQDLLDGVFESSIAIFRGPGTYFVEPHESGAYVLPVIRRSKSSEPISWQRFDSTNNRLIIYHIPSALDEFETLVREKGWAIERITE